MLKFLPSPPMIRMVVIADSEVTASTQLTATPFRPSLTWLIVRLDINGELSGAESLKRVKVVELIVTGGATPSGVTSGMKVSDTPFARVTVNSHLLNSPIMLHVSSS